MKTGNDNMTHRGISAFRSGHPLVRTIAAIIIVTFSGLVTSPAVAAIRAEVERQERLAPPEQSEAEKLNATLRAVKRELRKLADSPESAIAARSVSPESGISAAEREAAREALKVLRQQLKAQDAAARVGFRAIEKHIKKHKLSDVILQRHHDAVAKYTAEADALLESLAIIEDAKDDKLQEKAAKAFELLEKTKLKRSHKPFDPDKMPFGRPDHKVRKPALSAEAFSALGIEPTQDFLAASLAMTSGTGFGADDPANPAYLAATPDAQITPAIEQLAAELEHNPVKIHNWVRNNIEYLPTYGSLQGAQQTLDNRKGNAFDTASLLIALLRASGIPARYAYGTVEVAADKVMNWVGGVTDPMAAGNLLGQGGVPNAAMVSGGRISAFRLEHVWVEAWVDFFPSRGERNRVGDTWVPLDASFKQYEYTDGMDVEQAVPFDAESFAQDVIASATVNETEGWVQGVDQTLIQSRMEAYRADVEAFINAQDPGTTVGDVLGTKTIIPRDLSILPSVLPMKPVVIGARYAELPNNLRLKFRYQLQDNYGFELATFQANAVDVAGKRVALSFRPATEADAELIASYLPEPPADGSPIDPGDLPDSLPGYLINLTAEFTVDGEVVQNGPTVTMGTEIKGQLGYYFPDRGWDPRPKSIVAGEYQAIGLDLAGVAPAQLETLKADLEQARTKLQNDDPEGLTRHSLTGNLMQASVLSYFAMNDTQDQVSSSTRGVIISRMPSFGTFSSNIKTDYYFGMPRNVHLSGTLMDIDYSFVQAVDKGNSKAAVVNYMTTIGPRTSALET